MLRAAAIAALLAGCGCPRSLCDQWLVVPVTTEAWTVGTWQVDVVAGDAELHCTIEVLVDDLAPTPEDIVCNQLVIKDDFSFDTAGNVDPDEVLELRMVTGHGADVPPAATVVVTWRSDDTSAPIRADAVVLDWAEHEPSFGACAGGCFSTVVPIELPVTLPQG